MLVRLTLCAGVHTASSLRCHRCRQNSVSLQRQASTSVQHLVLPSHWSQRNAMVPDLVRCYGACGRTIVFTETKRDANDLVTALGDSVRALHGDIPQVCRGNIYHRPSIIATPQFRTKQCCSVPSVPSNKSIASETCFVRCHDPQAELCTAVAEVWFDTHNGASLALILAVHYSS